MGTTDPNDDPDRPANGTISSPTRNCVEMTTECRRPTDHDSLFAGIDVWNRANPGFSIPDGLVAQNVFAPFDGVDGEVTA
ncbi:hypothetical protein [Haladaptatus sp. CMAA 1911]|uniref:hypothetical protein n=1 Tax=unclassified Haladaptatus TaxID=2622732 RepID=UPI003754DAAB